MRDEQMKALSDRLAAIQQMKALSDRLAAIQAKDMAIRARVAAMRREREAPEPTPEQEELVALRSDLRSALATLQQECAIRLAMQVILGDVAKRGAMTDAHGATCCVATYTPGQGYAHAANCVVERSRALLALVGQLASNDDSHPS